MSSTQKNKIAQAAEAVIYKEKDSAIKSRIKKKYRIDEIDDELRKVRTSLESKILLKASRNKVNVPLVRKVEGYDIEMEFIEGEAVKDILTKTNYTDLIPLIAKQITLLHDANIAHGDLTTSNMIYHDKDVFIIDFGLAQNTIKVENKAVDIYLFKQALESKHHEIFEICFDLFVKNYKTKDKQKIMERLEDIEKRRRYKS